VRLARHTVTGVLEALLIIGIIATIVFGYAAFSGIKPGGAADVFAARNAKTGAYSVSVDQAGPYSFGQLITVSTNTPVYPDNAGPWIDLSCWQDGVKVLNSTHGGFSGSWYFGSPFALGPTQMWSGGPANCKVWVYHNGNRRLVTDATTTFSVNG
jgi:hypothetical protein